MSRRKSAAGQTSRQQLLALWEGEEAFGRPLGCVATSYTFDAAFFEEQCLARFIRMEYDPDEDQRSYVLEREERLSQVGAWILVDQAHVAATRSLRWHLLPVRVPDGGIMHAKISLLAWEQKVRVLIGSANLTKPGYRSNFENVATLDFGGEDDLPPELLGEVLGFLQAIRALSPGQETGAQRTLAAFLRSIEKRLLTWPSVSWPRGEPRCWFVPVAPERPSLFEGLAGAWPHGDADRAWVLSPFYDDGPGVHQTVAGLGRLMLKRGERSICFMPPGRQRTDGSIELDLPEALRDSGKPSLSFNHAFVPERDSDDKDASLRRLHAKSLWLERDDRALFVMGSSNFTRAGTGVGQRINVEANLAYSIPRLGDAFSRACEAAYPPYQELDPDRQELHFIGTAQENSDEQEGHTPLPDAFGAATFVPDPDGCGVLRLEISGQPPASFAIRGPGDSILLDGASWRCAGSPAKLETAWPAERPPSALEVTWTAGDGSRQQSLWVVNVEDTASLPPPEELRNLDLKMLMEILTSSRPAHETARRLLDERAMKAALAIEVDPHKKVDTSKFLLNRMKRLSAALEGLRDRLTQPVFSLDALRWRLHGPLGPIALARRLKEEEGEGAAFMIAEVAMTVHDARPRLAPGAEEASMRLECQAVVKTLEQMALAQPGPANLNEYVRLALQELPR